MPELARRLLLVKPAVVLTDDRKASLLSFALQSSMLGAGSEATDDGTGLNLAPAQTTPPPALSTVIVDVAAAQKLLGKQHSIQRPRLPLPPPPVEGGVSGTISTPQLCLIIFTAGTAGQPQAALLGHAAVCWAVEKWCSQLGLGPADRHALLLPPWLSAGRLGQWSALAGGARILLPPPAEASPSLKPLRAKLLDWPNRVIQSTDHNNQQQDNDKNNKQITTNCDLEHA
ncbi:unnamed protein product [Polarella glacialis]|uniref:AMP-dependent synthetase/ligase domain-containing protein n=1 Tax=Polarella glacialis TaxID=89957 RepID=A0A813G0T7_POLGL|nr:unnamed protein product [Polarella glacialis]